LVAIRDSGGPAEGGDGGQAANESRFGGELAQRVLDVVVASSALVLLLPVVALAALAIRLESRGPVFYRCRRVGLEGREFSMLKFRKMRADVAGAPLTAHDDERFTRIGRVLAKTKLDEIPQLWNVFLGSMSLVGPRPEDPSFVALRQTEYERILRVKPGITGLSQLAFAREMEILDPTDRIGDYVRRLMPQKMRLDDLYATRRSILVDLRILSWTVIAVGLRREVAVSRETGRLNLRRRPRRAPSEALQMEGGAT
jgi:lipopolysaccharide/colanic/teichoic acid biosynthesis glycosyltransferase